MRTSIKILRTLAYNINRATDSPQDTFINAAGTHNVIFNIGHYMIEPGSAMYGHSWKLVRIVNEDGGQTTICCAHNAATLEYQMRAWLEGYETAKGN